MAFVMTNDFTSSRKFVVCIIKKFVLVRQGYFDAAGASTVEVGQVVVDDENAEVGSDNVSFNGIVGYLLRFCSRSVRSVIARSEGR